MKKYYYAILILVLTILPAQAKSLRVEPAAVAKNPHSYKILDTRSADLYQKAHLIGALNFPVALTYEHKKVNGKILAPARMQKIVRALGLSVADNIAIYDDGSFFDAARLFWTFEVYGFTHVKLINGGMKQWLAAHYKTTKRLPKVTPSTYIASVNRKRLATKFSTQIATKSPQYAILDARGLNAYNGKVSSAKRLGHIIKALHFPASHNISYSDDSEKLKSDRDLAKLYKNIKPNTKIIVYCAIGRIASVNYFALRELNYDVANYDASWKEWGNDFTLPIEGPVQ